MKLSRVYKCDKMTFADYRGVQLLKDEWTNTWTINSKPELFGKYVYWGGYDKLAKVKNFIDSILK